MGDNKAVVGFPRIDAIPPLLSFLGYIGAIENLKEQTKAAFHF